MYAPSLNPRDRRFRGSRIASRIAPVSCGNSQVLPSRSRRCIDPWRPSPLARPSSPSLAYRSLVTHSLSLSLSAAVFLFPTHPSSSFLVPPARYAHATLGVTSRGQHVGEFNICPLLRFLGSLRPLDSARTRPEKRRWLKGSALSTRVTHQTIIPEIVLLSSARIYGRASDPAASLTR